MIEVIYYQEHNRLTVTGHANSDEYGHDLICAACSALALTLAANVEYLTQGGYATEPVTVLQEGNGEISCRAKRRYRYSVRQTFMSVCIGFEVLERQYPDYISYQVQG